MAKPTKHATQICLVLSVLAMAGIASGLLMSEAIVIAIFLLPTVIYEVYRTEGKSTKLASWGMLLVLLAEIVFLAFNIDINLAEFLGKEEQLIGGRLLPLGSIKVLAPAIMAILSVTLLTKTRGKYTICLSVIIFITAFAIIYVIDPDVFRDLFQQAVEEGLERIE